MKKLAITLLFVFCVHIFSSEPISRVTKGMKKHTGFFVFYWDQKEGRILLEIAHWNQKFLYINYLTTGLGSNDIGLDRGQVGMTRVVYFKRIGPKVLLIEPNLKFRALTANVQEQLSVQEAFAQSVLWGFKVLAQDGTKVVVDASDFFLRDAHEVVARLKQKGQGDFALDHSRSAFYPLRCKSFPKNTEIESILTFTSDAPGPWVRSIAPDAKSITVRQHHSLVKLPNVYKARKADPRAGLFSVNFYDYSAKASTSMRQSLVVRHRLNKKKPQAPSSEPVKPIVYYVDSGIPEPIRSTIVEGAMWWNQAFTAIGYKDAFKVKILPQDVDPQDIRYNVIQWVHRSTRGWSYGPSVVDPRTGEIIKAHIVLGSLRIRQDYLIAEGLLAPYKKNFQKNAMLKMALARLRQLSAHEVGHTLGLAHNFAASVNDRSSVMDYPHPKVKINYNSTLNLADAYDVGIGEWDKVAINYAYQDFSGKKESLELAKILQQAREKGLLFISDSDARPAGGAHPLAHLWDNGAFPIKRLEHVLKVRQIALDRFGANNIQKGAFMASLEEALVPVYLYHRYQTEAVAKMLGGMLYSYTARGDNQVITKIVAADKQRKALQILLKTIDPKILAIPKRIIKLIPPRPMGYPATRELFPRRTGVTFDPMSPVEIATSFTLRFLLHPQRATRLVQFHARNSQLPSLFEVIETILKKSWYAPRQKGYMAEVQRTVNQVVLTHLINLAVAKNASFQARAAAKFKLKQLQQKLELELKNATQDSQKAHLESALGRAKTLQAQNLDVVKLPPGSPIGECSCFNVFGSSPKW